MGAAIEAAQPKARVALKPGGRGDFIVTVDGRELWNKRAMDDEFPDEQHIVRALKMQSK